MTGPGPLDPGLQPERTQLAWRRTLLAVAAVALLTLRTLPPVLGPWSSGIGIGGLLASAAMWSSAARRARRTGGAPGAPAPDGRLLLCVSVVVGVTAALGAIGVLLRSAAPH